MPSLPTFVIHVRGGAPSTSVSFGPSSQRGIKQSSNRNALWFTGSTKLKSGRGGAGVGIDDPSLLYSANSGHGAARYEELTDFEGQKGMQTKREELEVSMNNMNG